MIMQHDFFRELSLQKYKTISLRIRSVNDCISTILSSSFFIFDERFFQKIRFQILQDFRYLSIICHLRSKSIRHFEIDFQIRQRF